MDRAEPGDADPSPTVAMDTSALMMPVECEVRVFEELDRLLDGVELVAPATVEAELERLSAGAGTEGTAASVGLELLADRCTVVETDADVADDALVELARDDRVDYVATNDRELAGRINDESVPVIGLRGRNKLAVTQP